MGSLWLLRRERQEGDQSEFGSCCNHPGETGCVLEQSNSRAQEKGHEGQDVYKYRRQWQAEELTNWLRGMNEREELRMTLRAQN